MLKLIEKKHPLGLHAIVDKNWRPVVFFHVKTDSLVLPARKMKRNNPWWFFLKEMFLTDNIIGSHWL